MAMYCTNCGKEIAAGVAFCTECGTKAPEAVTEPKTEAVAEAVLCKKCGTALPEGVAFCTECGTPRSGEPSAAPPQPAISRPPMQPQQSYIPPVQTPPPAQTSPPVAVAPDANVVGTGTFFGLQLLFALPGIGWLACLIMAFAPKNKNIRNYARAMLIWTVLGLVVAATLFFFFKWIGGVLTDYINEISDGAFGGFGSFFEEFKELGNMTDQLSGGLEGLPTE